jgi:16S rRNA G966 N2-methylase RsmD
LRADIRDVAGLHYGDNLQVLLDSIASESVDLTYLDPPFNSNATVGRADVCCFS